MSEESELFGLISAAIEEMEGDMDGDDAVPAPPSERRASFAEALQEAMEAERVRPRALPQNDEDGARDLMDRAQEAGINSPRDFRFWIQGILQDAASQRIELRGPADIAAFLARFDDSGA